MSIKNKIVFLLALKIVTAGLALTQADWDQFKAFVANTGKNYLTKSELLYRFSIFAERKAAIERFNSEEHSFRKGLNKFTDLTAEERKKFLGFRSVTSSKAEKGGNKGKPVTSPFFSTSGERRLDGSANLDTLPRSVDWVAQGKVSSVKDQGGCGSCWAFAVAAQLESYYLISESNSYDFSEQQLVDCSYLLYGNYACQGGLNTTTLDYIYNRGIGFEDEYPYHESLGFCNFWNTNRLYIDAWYYLYANNFDDLMYFLGVTPISVAFYASDELMDYESGVFDAVSICDNTESINHAVLAVGYDFDAATPYVHFKNSWSTSWGEDGFFKMNFLYQDDQNGPCNLVNHEESTFVADLPE